MVPTRMPVGRERVRRGELHEAQVGGIDPERDGDLVELDLEPEARLRRAVAALGSAGRLVGEGPAAAETVARDVVGDGLQRAGVEGRGDAVAAVRAAVEERLERLARRSCRPS